MTNEQTVEDTQRAARFQALSIDERTFLLHVAAHFYGRARCGTRTAQCAEAPDGGTLVWCPRCDGDTAMHFPSLSYGRARALSEQWLAVDGTHES